MKPINNNNTLTALTSLKIIIPLVFRMVFSNRLYIAIAATVFTTFWTIFIDFRIFNSQQPYVFDQLLFFSPIVTFYVPNDAITGLF
jgi:hypothetical protein